MMRLLFVTQKIDKDDDILGVYHSWIEELAKKVSHISVVCLQQGKTELPQNVGVYSLGKESGQSKIKYLWRFYKYLWQLKGKYDKVFVHMNPEYMLLAGLYWKLTGKKTILWYNHPLGSFKARSAIYLADVVLHTSPLAYASRFKKSKVMPVGVDTNRFINDKNKKNGNSILYLGRISPIKYLEHLVGAAKILKEQGVKFKVAIIGDPTPGKEAEIIYENKIKSLVVSYGLENYISFSASVPNSKAPAVYRKHDIFVNMTPSGSFDKTIIEAMACEIPVVCSNKSLNSVMSDNLVATLQFRENNSQDFADKLKSILARDDKPYIGKKLRKMVKKEHSLEELINKLVKIFEI